MYCLSCVSERSQDLFVYLIAGFVGVFREKTATLTLMQKDLARAGQISARVQLRDQSNVIKGDQMEWEPRLSRNVPSGTRSIRTLLVFPLALRLALCPHMSRRARLSIIEPVCFPSHPFPCLRVWHNTPGSFEANAQPAERVGSPLDVGLSEFLVTGVKQV